MDCDGVAFLRADVERFCGEVVDVAPAVRLRMLAELRAMVDEVTSTALTSAMISAQDEGWGCGGSRRSRGCRMSRCAGWWRRWPGSTPGSRAWATFLQQSADTPVLRAASECGDQRVRVLQPPLDQLSHLCRIGSHELVVEGWPGGEVGAGRPNLIDHVDGCGGAVVRSSAHRRLASSTASCSARRRANRSSSTSRHARRGSSSPTARDAGRRASPSREGL